MNVRRRSCCLPVVCLLALLGLATGCGQSAGNTTRVTGAVSVKAQPLSGALLKFFPASGERAESGVVEADGTYTVALAPGSYKVTVQVSRELPPDWKEGDSVPPPALQPPKACRQLATTPLTVDVPAESPHQYDIKL